MLLQVEVTNLSSDSLLQLDLRKLAYIQTIIERCLVGC